MKFKRLQIEYILLGLLVGTMVGLRVGSNLGIPWGVVSALACASVLGLLLGAWLDDQSIFLQSVIQFGIEGIIISLLVMIGILKVQLLGIIAGVGAGITLYGLGIGTLVWKAKTRDHYLAFRGEPLWVSFLGLVGALAGFGLVNGLAASRFNKWIPGLQDNKVLIGIATGIVLSILLSASIGFLVAVNRRRPVLGGVLAMVGGALVLWVGISIAPILFLPGSGLYWSGMLLGLLIIGCGLLAIAFPAIHLPFGLAVVIFSILSFIGAAGGLVLGGLLGLLAGALIVSWMGVDLVTEIPTEEAVPELDATHDYDVPVEAGTLADLG